MMPFLNGRQSPSGIFRDSGMHKERSMARHVFFSFNYADIWRVNVVRNSHVVEGTAVAGFRDGSLWEEAKKKGDAAIKKMICDALEGTSVTCVLIGEKTSQREYVTYEIEKSIE